jgi:hypothetical protein
VQNFSVVVQFEKTIRIRAHLSGVPQPIETPTRFSGSGGNPAAESRFTCQRIGGVAEAKP